MEAVGLLLGSIPIIISVLEHYPEGIRMMRRSRRYTRELASIARRLRLESSILQNTCEKLLENFTTYEELEALIAEPGGARWKDRDLDKRLRGFLGSSYMDYKESVDDMVEAKKELEILLRLDSNGKVNISSQIIQYARLILIYSRLHKVTSIRSEIASSLFFRHASTKGR